MQNFIRKWYPIAIILLLAAALRINMMIHRGTLQFDEWYSVHFSSVTSWVDTWHYWTLETNPPFYHLFLKIYLSFVNQNNEFLLRLPSFIFSLITITLLYIYAQKIFSRHTAILSALFLTLTTFHVRYSTEIRMYSLFIMVVMISFLLYNKIAFENKNSRALWFFYTLITTIMLYTHLTALAFIIIQFIALIYVKSDKTLTKKWLLSQTISVSLWLFWFIPSLTTQLNSDIKNAWYLNIYEFTNHTLINSIIMPFIEFRSDNHFFTTVVTFLIVAIPYLLYKKTQTTSTENKNRIFLISIWALIPISVAAMVGIFVPRYLMSAYLGVFLLTAYLIDLYTADSSKKFSLTLVCIIIFMLPSTISATNHTIINWQPLVTYIQTHENKNSLSMIFFSDAEVFKKYYTGARPVIGIYTREDNLSNNERIIRYNWNKHNISDTDAKKWLMEKIQENKTDKIFFIFTNPSSIYVTSILTTEGWRTTNIIRTLGDISYTLFELEKSNK